VKTSQNFLFVGILVIIAGIILLVISSSSGIGTSTFFFFPFFFVGTSDVTTMILLMALAFFICVLMMWSAITYFSQIESQHDDEIAKQYIQVGVKCIYCSKPLPIDAEYCSSCGNPVDHDKTLNQ